MDDNKSILLVMTALFAGGAEKQYRYIMEAISEENKVSVLLLNNPIIGEEDNTKKFILEHNNIRFIQLNGNALNKVRGGKNVEKFEKIRSLLIQWIWLKKNLKNNQFDVVMFSYVTQLLMVPLFNRYNVKTIFNERNTGRQVCNKKYKKSLLKKCSCVIANSEYAAKIINDKTGIDVAVFRNGIKMNTIKKKEHKMFNILVPARINAIKNQIEVVNAITLLRDFLSKEEYEMINCFFAGMCEDDIYLNEIKRIIQDNALNISILGFVDDMSEIYSKTDLIILPSYEEGTPNVLLEAYMYRINALVSRIPMNVACCVNEDMLFSPDDPRELAKRIVVCIKEGRPETYFKTNYAYLVENYSILHMKERYIELFKSIE